MNLWAIAHQANDTLPDRFQNRNTLEIAGDLKVACHVVGGAYTNPAERENPLTALDIENHPDHPYQVELRGLPIEHHDEGECIRTHMQTPTRPIVTHIRRTRQMQKDGISLSFVESYAIESPDDSGAIGSVFEHHEVVPTPESYRLFQRRVGDDGIAVARGPVAASPIHLMRHELALMDQ